MKIANYLNVTFNLNDKTYKLCIKQNHEIKHIHKESNYPPSMIYQISLPTESRLSTLSYNKNIFQEALCPYQKALKKLWL